MCTVCAVTRLEHDGLRVRLWHSGSEISGFTQCVDHVEDTAEVLTVFCVSEMKQEG